MVQKKKLQKQPVHPAQTPGGYVVTGLIMWVIGYMLSVLAVDSGSLLQLAGTAIAFIWGSVRIIQGIVRAISDKK